MPASSATAGLDAARAARFAALPLHNLGREYPNHLMHLVNDAADLRGPRELHPIFWGSYDWHSAVHGFWLLARCLRRHPQMPDAAAIAALFDAHLTAAHGEAEAAYFRAPGRAGYERPYGWGWLLALVAECERLSHPNAAVWRKALRPLEDVIAGRVAPYLSKLTYPVRVGTHYNTAFALVLALDYARQCADDGLAGAIVAYARRVFLRDADYPAHYEPNGDDFLSGALAEALLMTQVLPAAEFAAWFAAFLPHLAFSPAIVADRGDAKGVHLDGLNLSRAWCLRGIAAALPEARRPALLAMAEAHEATSLPFLESGEYGGEHWLATFAALAVEGLG
jgi:hypothetical protein